MIQASRCVDDLLEQLWKFTVNLTAQTRAPDLKSTFTLYCQVFQMQSGNSLSALNSVFFWFIFKLPYLFVQVSYSFNYLKQEKVDGRMNLPCNSQRTKTHVTSTPLALNISPDQSCNHAKRD